MTEKKRINCKIESRYGLQKARQETVKMSKHQNDAPLKLNKQRAHGNTPVKQKKLHKKKTIYSTLSPIPQKKTDFYHTTVDDPTSLSEIPPEDDMDDTILTPQLLRMMFRRRHNDNLSHILLPTHTLPLSGRRRSHRKQDIKIISTTTNEDGGAEESHVVAEGCVALFFEGGRGDAEPVEEGAEDDEDGDDDDGDDDGGVWGAREEEEEED
ncbi:hypothetical protein BC829DRAFT_416940 [Chytridium lagenaria]|nr:hypothetical protein BC829DRAFT_416940 [Chytridium lagenaria]